MSKINLPVDIETLKAGEEVVVPVQLGEDEENISIELHFKMSTK